ncbi:unnamed protein product [Periconia digitata]|uniref:Uncharacterized protein n=1 Tax=Periconia digitata TaxID=1303443 RepID=A0A9W4UQR6_9PLEO|nr:unnamed protein product [Periconia digitata]
MQKTASLARHCLFGKSPSFCSSSPTTSLNHSLSNRNHLVQHPASQLPLASLHHPCTCVPPTICTCHVVCLVLATPRRVTAITSH